MGITARGPRTITDPAYAYAPICYLRESWSDEWQPTPELRLVHGQVSTAGHGGSEVQVRVPYGAISHPWETAFGVRLPVSLRGWWLRLDLVGPDGPVTQFVGRISSETRLVEGADQVRSGEQVWVAHGPQRILDRIWFHDSYQDGFEVYGDSLDEIRIGWLPDMNRRDKSGALVGNRSADKYQAGEDPDDETDVYLYGTEAVWNHEQFLRYLLQRYVDESESGGPRWTIGGQYELLEELETVIEFDATATVGETVRKLVHPHYGVDYVIRTVADGFEIEVFALVGDDHAFRGATLPANPNRVEYRAGADLRQRRTLVETSDDDLYNVIRLVGKRAIICCSLGGVSCDVEPIRGTLTGKWSDALEQEYKDGVGTNLENVTPEQHDAVRTDPRFEGVYTVWAADVYWNLQASGATAAFTKEGDFDAEAAEDANYQAAVRSTLDWLPLRAGVDYAEDPPADSSPAGHQADLLAPIVFMSDPGEYQFGSSEWIYKRADHLGIGVSALRDDYGVKLACSPNHLVAAGTFSGAQPTTAQPVYDPDRMAVTLAFEADRRVTAEVRLDEEDPAAPSSGVLEIHDRDVECWLLAPHTVVGVDRFGSLATSGDGVRVLREDAGRIGLVLAGAIARHHQARARAEITVEGLVPWAGLLGHILAAVEEAGDTHTVGAALSSVEWSADDAGNATTTIRTGFARSHLAQ